MGNRNCTVKNLRIVKVDESAGVILVRGAVPGANGSVSRHQESFGFLGQLELRDRGPRDANGEKCVTWTASRFIDLEISSLLI
jgi:hypothetical protein